MQRLRVEDLHAEICARAKQLLQAYRIPTPNVLCPAAAFYAWVKPDVIHALCVCYYSVGLN